LKIDELKSLAITNVGERIKLYKIVYWQTFQFYYPDKLIQSKKCLTVFQSHQDKKIEKSANIQSYITHKIEQKWLLADFSDFRFLMRSTSKNKVTEIT
jgi:hypothetical protein